jgi:hypothetical protein
VRTGSDASSFTELGEPVLAAPRGLVRSRNPPLGDLGNDQCRVVVALLRPLVELPCLVEKRRDARHPLGPVDRQLQGARHVPRKFVAIRKVVDLEYTAPVKKHRAWE